MKQVKSAVKELIWIGEYIMRGNWYQIIRRLKNILRVMTEDVEYIVRILNDIEKRSKLISELSDRIRAEKLNGLG